MRNLRIIYIGSVIVSILAAIATLCFHNAAIAVAVIFVQLTAYSILLFMMNRQFKAEKEKYRIELKEGENVLNRKQENDIRWIRSMLSHNVRMPLSIVIGYCNLLTRGVIKEEEKKRECLDKISGNIRYLSDVVNLAIDIDEKTDDQNTDELNLYFIVSEVTGYVHDLAEKAKIDIQINCEDEGIVIRGNRIQIMRIFYNLYENSIKYMGNPGKIIITISQQEDGVFVFYKDTGNGMRKEEAEHIFEYRYRGSGTDGRGSGCGMYFVKEVIDAHNGSVTVSSDEGKGMGIYIRFPRMNL